MKKRIILPIMVVILIFTPLFNALASGIYSPESAQIFLKNLDIMVGDENGNMNLGDNVTRAEFAKIAVNSSKYKNLVALGATISVFKDCTYTHWAAPYVKVAVTNGAVTGYPDGTFKPDNPVLYEEAITVFLKLLGYTDEDFGSSWPYGQASLAANIGLNKNIQKGIGEYLSRGDVMALVYNALTTKQKNSEKEYINSIDGSFYEDVIVISTNNEDTSVGANSVLTSVGTFKKNDAFDNSFVGCKGDLAVKNTGEIIAFMPYGQKNQKYVVYSKLANSIVAYKDGMMTELDVSDNTTVYYGSEKYTFANAKSKMSIGDVIYVMCNDKGSIEYLTLQSDVMEGPYTLSASSDTWYKIFTDNPDTLTVMRDGEKVSLTGVKTNDVLYYSPDLNIVFSYSKKITGIYEKAIPNKDTPTSVVISGSEYQIESIGAFNKLSSSGSVNFGDTVTLLFGKDGKIADAIGANMTSARSSTVAGYLIDTGSKAFENSNGETYTSKYVKLILPNGTEAQYTTNYDYSSYLNSVMQVSFNGGVASLSSCRTDGSVCGKANVSKMKIGDYAVSSDIKIIDVSTTNNNHAGSYCTTYMSRLDGVNILSSNVLWSKKNSDGEVCELILKDVTGDSFKYGVVTESSNNGSYTVELDGNAYRCNSGKYNNIHDGSFVQAELAGSTVESLSPLKSFSTYVSSLTQMDVCVKNIIYKLAGNVCAYKKTGVYTYSIVPISELVENFDNYKITAYYDKDEKYGGRIRVLVAE